MARNTSTPRVGLITTMSLDTTWPESFVRYAGEIHRQAHELFRGLGYEVVAQDGIARTNAEMTAQGEHLRAQHAEVLVLQVATWTYSNTAISAALASDVPVIVWSNATPGRFGIVGASIVRGSLDAMGIRNAMLHGVAEDPAFIRRLDLLCRSYAAAMRLRGQTLGMGGFRCMGMYTALFDPLHWRKKFGIDVDNWEQAVVVQRAREMDDAEAKRFLAWMKQEFGRVVPKDEVMLAQIRLYLALRELVQEKGYDFIAVKCLPDMPSFYTTFCVAHAMLNDRSDLYGPKESIVCGCEADANGTLTMQMLKLLTGGPALFTDVLGFDAEAGSMTLCNCGSQPTDFARCRKDVYWVTEGLAEFQWKIGGACPQYVARSGEVTFARLGRLRDRDIMLITSGTVVEKDREALRALNYQQPQAFVNLHCSSQGFVDQLRSNHIHMVYGQYTEHLKELCRVLDIEVMEPR